MSQSTDPNPRDRDRASSTTGAYSIGEKKRRAAWLIPLLLLLGALALALLLWALLHNRGDDKGTAAVGTTSVSPTPSEAPLETATPSAAAAPSDAVTPSAGTGISTGTGAGAAALVGGGSVAAHAMTGVSAAAGQLGTVLFDTDSAALNAEARKVIVAAAAAIKAKGSGTVSVTGYADVVGGQPVNNQLTQRRADVVRQALETTVGTSGVTFATAAKGAANPVASNSTEAGRQQNRRATITLAP